MWKLDRIDRKECLYSRSFRFYKHFEVSEKNMGCLAHQKYVGCISIIYSQCRHDSEVQNRMIFRDREASFVCDRDPRSILIDIHYFDIPTH